MADKQKILVCGDVEGKFKALFSRVSLINEKSGPFDFLLCVGDFFGDSPLTWEPYKNGILHVPVPTYILGPNKEKHLEYYSDINGCEMCPNVNYLGKRGILTSNGLKIAYVSGCEGSGSDVTFSEKDAVAVRDIAYKSRGKSNFLGVDVLLTSEWPKNITNLDGNKNVPDSSSGSQHLAWLTCQLKPRYHFSGLRDVFYERPPYANYNPSEEGDSHCTRFIALAKVGNPGKNKWIYAASLTPIDQMKKSELYQMTSDQTDCPFSKIMTRPNLEEGKQYFYDMKAPDDKKSQKRKHRNDSESEKKKMNFDNPENCWFCLASAAVEKNLVISIGDETYLALAKGALTPDHVMILPIQHHQSLIKLTDEVKEEIKKFKSALRKLFKTENKVPVFFERNYKTSHLQMHVIPVPKEKAGKLRIAFEDSAESQGIELHELPDHSNLEDLVQPGSPYFYLELPSKEKYFCSKMKNFPLQFGRDVLASEEILNLPERENWRDCVFSKEEENKMVNDFREKFEEFDFTT